MSGTRIRSCTHVRHMKNNIKIHNFTTLENFTSRLKTSASLNLSGFWNGQFYWCSTFKGREFTLQFHNDQQKQLFRVVAFWNTNLPKINRSLKVLFCISHFPHVVKPDFKPAFSKVHPHTPQPTIIIDDPKFSPLGARSVLRIKVKNFPVFPYSVRFTWVFISP